MRYVVRYYEGGWRSTQRQKTFDRKEDADRFDTAVKRGKQLGQLAAELVGSEQTVSDFLQEWWEKYAEPTLKPGTLASYAPTLDRWVIPYLGRMRLRDLTREAVDTYRFNLVAAGAGAPTVNRCLAVLQGALQRAVEWRRIQSNPVAGVVRLKHTRSSAIDARRPEEVELVRAAMGIRDAALVSVLAYEGLRPAEAFALTWRHVLGADGLPRDALLVELALSNHELSTTKSSRARKPELFGLVARDLAELYMASGRPSRQTLVFPDAKGRWLRRQNWRKRSWMKALAAVWPCEQCGGTGGTKTDPCTACERSGSTNYFHPYNLRHTCATLLLYEGWTLNDVAKHLGHRDPGFTAREYAHVMEEASKRQRVPLTQAIAAARAQQLVLGES